jgi:hypothetical protein
MPVAQSCLRLSASACAAIQFRKAELPGKSVWDWAADWQILIWCKVT